MAEKSSLTIDSLVAKVVEANPEIAFYEVEVKAARAGRSVAGKLANPELNLEIGRKRDSGGGGAVAEGMAYSVSLSQPIEWPGRLGLRKAIANRDIELAELGLSRFRFFLGSKVRVLAYSLAAQQEVANVADEVAGRYLALKEVMVQRDPAGIAPLLETKTIEAATIVAQAKAAEAAIEVQKALLELNQLMGRRADTPLSVIRPEVVFGELSDLPALLNSAWRENYDLRVRRAELEQQGFKVDLAKNERYPAITVGPYLSKEEANGRETVAGVGLSIPLPLWNNGGASVTTAEARRTQAQATLTAVQREVERQVIEAAMLLKTMRARLTIWKSGAAEGFGEAAALADRHYRLGAVPISTYVELQDKYLEAVEAISASQRQALESALTLEQLIGAPNTFINPDTSKSKKEKP